MKFQGEKKQKKKTQNVAMIRQNVETQNAKIHRKNHLIEKKNSDQGKVHMGFLEFFLGAEEDE